ncbi:hypothetical protein [Ketobacter sp.]|uniref:hypothetical protein n=1 Tax=Ketobacter sp. TaxID=2083498 RepID=UPI000F1DDC1D|nr:hypothetical protein [Ketobacter sp.]RLT97421.1 MAG: hypothetical protein D9N14_11620 [Ketobacter sp.]
MKPIPGLTFIGCILLAGVAFSHPADPCLARIAQLAQSAKGCELTQKESGECDPINGQLEVQVQRCKSQQFTESAIQDAIEYGAAAVEGDVSQSPYRLQVKQQQWEYQMMKPNLERFADYFPEAHHIQDALLERFNTAACPKQYEGRPDRYRFQGHQTLSRYPGMDAAPDGSQSAEKHAFYGFSPERPGACYPVLPATPGTAEGAQKTLMPVNIPDYFLAELEQRERVRVLRCESDCEAEWASLASWHEEYSKQYRRHRQLLMCLDVEQRNENRRTVKGVRRTAIKLPDYCPEEEIAVQELNARGLLEELDRRLFLDTVWRPMPPEDPAKPE